MKNQQVILGIDIGGTKIAGGALSQRGRLLRTLEVPTLASEGFETSYGQVVSLIDELIKQSGGKQNIAGIGMCSPGPLNPKTGVVINPPNLPGWRNIALATRISRHFGVPARLENDANAAGLAEALIGAGAPYLDVLYATVSTGIGTGIIINKKIHHGKNGVAAEGGHVPIDYKSPFRCGCVTLGCIEALASGPSMVRRTRALLEQEHSTPSVLRDLAAGGEDGLNPHAIAQAARHGDRLARIILDDTGFFLGVWFAALITLLDPDAIVIGGGVARIGKPLFDKIRATIPHYTINRRFAVHTPLLPAKLEKQVGVFGAASLFLNTEQAPRAKSR